MKSRTSSWISDVDFCQRQYLGERENQEDFADMQIVGEDQSEMVAVLADGMGGHAAGEIASRLAGKVFLETFASLKTKTREGRLHSALQAANAEMSRRIAKESHLQGMGCTLVGLTISELGVSWVSVGDSPLFLFREGRLKRLNEDHSMMPVLEKLVTSGELSSAELARHPQRNSLRSALTGDRLTLIDSSLEPLNLKSGDVLLSASDGLLSLELEEVEKILMSLTPFSSSTACDQLISLIKQKSFTRQDNVTVQIFRFKRSGMVQRRKYVRFLSWSVFAATVLVGVGILLAKLPEFVFPTSVTHSKSREVTKEIQPIQIGPDSTQKVVSERAPSDLTPQPLAKQPSPPHSAAAGKPSPMPKPEEGRSKNPDTASNAAPEKSQALPSSAVLNPRQPKPAEGSNSPKSSDTPVGSGELSQSQTSSVDRPSSIRSATGVGLIGGQVGGQAAPSQSGATGAGGVPSMRVPD